MLRFFQEGVISVPFIPKELFDLSAFTPDLSASLTKEDIPFSDLQLLSGNSSPFRFIDVDFVSPVITFVKLLLLLRVPDLPFEIIGGTLISSVILLFAVL